MGQQCCSDGHAIKKQYNPDIDRPTSATPFSLRGSNLQVGLEGTQKQYEIVRNFSPVEKVPKLHHNVIEIQDKLRSFEPSHDFQAPSGTKETLAYAINNVGMVYDANSEWHDGLPHGWGRLLYQDGSCYTGTFIKGVPSGEGRFVSSQGWYYQGQLFKEQAQGKGSFSYEDIGYRYEGEWEGDLPNGRGHQTWTRPGFIASYEGEYVAGKKQGKGCYKSGDDWEYQGQFSNNQLTSARGLIKYKNGQRFEGGFLDGHKHGFGIYRWKDGSSYEGWYSHDKKHGHGKFITSDSKRFEGEWVEGRREGRGVLIVNGKKYPGEWHNDLPCSSKNL